jgi:hypothetical protein
VRNIDIYQRMNRLWLFRWQLVLLVVVYCCVSSGQVLRERYFGKFDEDSIIYHVISIPFNAYDLQLRVWIDKSRVQQSPKLLIKYDGLPTMTSYDGIFTIPPYPESLLISDSRPDMAQLYVSIWGGKLLHSNRYFAGSPSNTAFGMEATALICEGVFNDNECHPHKFLPVTILSASKSDAIPVSLSGLDIYDLVPLEDSSTSRIFSQSLPSIVGVPFVYTLSVPAKTELLLVTLTLKASALLALCNSASNQADYNATKRLFAQVYRDEADNLEDNGSEYLDFDCRTSCRADVGAGLTCSPIDLQFAVDNPMIGYWNLYIDLSYKPTELDNSNLENKEHGIPKIPRSRFTATLLRAGEEEMHIEAHGNRTRPIPRGGQPVTIDAEIVGYTCPTGRTGYSKVMKYLKSSVIESKKTVLVNCLDPVGDLTRLQSTDSATSAYVVYSSTHDGVIRWNRNTDTNFVKVDAYADFRNLTKLSGPKRPFAMFSIQAEPTSSNFPVGGYMEVSLRVRSRTPGHIDLTTDKITEIQSKTFAVAVRCGGLASDPFQEAWGVGDKMGDLHLGKNVTNINSAGIFSGNGMILLSTAATQEPVQLISSKEMKEEEGSLWWNPFEDKHSGWFNVVASWFSRLRTNGTTFEQSQETDDDNSEWYAVSQYRWLVSKPSLPYLNTGYMSVRVIPLEFPVAASSDDADESMLSLSVAFMSCSKSSCAHGICELQKGSVTASTCVCRYILSS